MLRPNPNPNPHIGSKQQQQSLPAVAPSDVQNSGFNVFRKLLGGISEPDHLHFMFTGFARLLNSIPQSESSYLPFSVPRITIEQELLVLLWKCLEENPKFMPYVLRHCDVNELLRPVCYFLVEGRKSPNKVGVLYLCTFILLKLSGERNFGVALNKPYSRYVRVFRHRLRPHNSPP